MIKINLKLAVLFPMLLVLFLAGCKKKEPTYSILTQIQNNIITGTWAIVKYEDSGKNETSKFTGFNFTFNSTGIITAVNGTISNNGTWSTSDSNSKEDSIDDLHFNINFNMTNSFADLNHDWSIVSQSANKLELRDVSGGNGGTELLTFEKN